MKFRHRSPLLLHFCEFADWAKNVDCKRLSKNIATKRFLKPLVFLRKKARKLDLIRVENVGITENTLLIKNCWLKKNIFGIILTPVSFAWCAPRRTGVAWLLWRWVWVRSQPHSTYSSFLIKVVGKWSKNWWWLVVFRGSYASHGRKLW